MRRHLAAAFLVAVSACSPGGGELPEGATLLAGSADAMAQVGSVDFRLEVEGPTGSTGVRGVSGVLTADGEGQGTVAIEQFGILVELEVVVAGGTFYVKGLTGGFQALPEATADQIYDPTALLEPDAGISELIRTGTEAVTEAREDVSGREAFRVKAMIDRSLIEDLIPLDPGADQVPATLWIATDDSRLLQVRVSSTDDEGERSVLTLAIDDFDVDATITPPAT